MKTEFIVTSLTNHCSIADALHFIYAYIYINKNFIKYNNIAKTENDMIPIEEMSLQKCF